MSLKEMTWHPIILFDGVCNLCVGSIQFVIKRDPRKIFRFASLQSAYGQKAMQARGLNSADYDTIILLEGDAIHQRSSAALRIARRLSGLWPLMFYLFIWWPAFFRDAVYRFIAKRRYRWFGKRESCMVPTAEVRGRFLE